MYPPLSHDIQYRNEQTHAQNAGRQAGQAVNVTCAFLIQLGKLVWMDGDTQAPTVRESGKKLDETVPLAAPACLLTSMNGIR